MGDQSLLRDARTIEGRSDNQERVYRNRCSDAPEFVDCAAGALLPGADDEGQALIARSHFVTRRRDHFQILAFVKIYAFARGAEHYKTDNRSLAPLRQIRTQGLEIDCASRTKRRGNRQKNAAQIFTRQRGVGRVR